MSKRKIIPFIERPSILSEDIYVVMGFDEKEFIISVESKKGFKSGKQGDQLAYGCNFLKIINPTELLESLAEKNNAEIDYLPLYKQGIKYHQVLESAPSKLKEFLDTQ